MKLINVGLGLNQERRPPMCKLEIQANMVVESFFGAHVSNWFYPRVTVMSLIAINSEHGVEDSCLVYVNNFVRLLTHIKLLCFKVLSWRN